ncbi:threonine/serine dehydratase [Amycolatopsis sp. WQ 127309]|uniref:threonine ammonia-lyase n=1 Tax=Amycolatopsis sp. WQ 127309 TaxID=2932773 RepID=UPI001FF255E6|nr:pyridoxal-phosphate dependent enzyme [Amycolatopsis sp. WQ 127309]UOZ02728.1 pyridoxal-phosphate dependent enzyme [Amycolatopsis sp. WQ 127309]
MPAPRTPFARQCLAARDRIGPLIRRTPILTDPDTGIHLKCENEQVTGSFKARGALNALTALGPAAVVVGSSGNHGIATAWAASRMGADATVVMTEATSAYKRNRIRRLGARVITCAGGNNARGDRVAEIAAATGAVPVSSYDHPLVVAGQASVGFEILEQLAGATTIVVPVGGGGLLAGVAAAVEVAGRRVRVVAAEPRAANDTALSLAAGRRIVIDPPVSLCDGVLAQTPGAFTFPLIRRLVDEVVEVGEDEVLAAMQELAVLGLTVEPTGALAFAAARTLPAAAGTVAVVSGGNVEPAEFRRLTGASRYPARP